MRKWLILGWLAVALVTTDAAAQITVAAAADLNTALTEMASAYQKESGQQVRLSFGSSGNLCTQIENGAPFDVFLSADLGYPRKLIAADLADRSSLYVYAIGRIVLWVPAASPLDLEHQGVRILLDPSVKRIAIANPEHAPYGRAAVAALKKLGVYDQIRDRLVLGENIAQAAQFVESGNAQAGVVAYAHAILPAMKNAGKYWEFPLNSYPPLEQGAVIVSRSPHKQAAEEFLLYLKGAQARSILRTFGFSTGAD
jgi:molybdate transport system substrate-binding protein